MSETPTDDVTVCAACWALWAGDETQHFGLDGRPGMCANKRHGWYWTVTVTRAEFDAHASTRDRPAPDSLLK